ncbi:hypothetical protein jhhlp_007812 [Lomentospora prolificans]|uniref:Uncharacterized protein n=1 Tax=Lomentospora prolificans TaxID=41688 RepID=A0A2N3N0L6_9PEZI|nr:hypothetical protein jhhlp_007812 [Lomentospora prolificans]
MSSVTVTAEGADAPQDFLKMVSQGDYLDVLTSPSGKTAIRQCIASLQATEANTLDAPSVPEQQNCLALGIAAFDAFLQVNVTGPVLEGISKVEALLTEGGKSLEDLRKECLKALEVDGVSPYAYIPSLELFFLARFIIFNPVLDSLKGKVAVEKNAGVSLGWLRLRILVWHYKLLTQPSLGPSSSYMKTAQWSDVPTLISKVYDAADAVRDEVLAEGNAWTSEEKIRCLLELANNDIMLGRDDKAREAIKAAKELSRFEYALTGALGKKTKYQENSTSQLVILARSATEITQEDKSMAVPGALPLNDDVLLEKIAFEGRENGVTDQANLSDSLKGLEPDEQPPLTPLDQIILLTEAMLKDAFSPLDALTSEEIMPYAVRVLQDKSTNWQIYTQALIVRSRVEVHRSRTVERGVLQMQAVVDQVVVDTSSSPTIPAHEQSTQGEGESVPTIAVSAPRDEAAPVEEKPTSFFRAAEPMESAPAHERLRYIHALSTPPRWHLESELAYGWTGIGALVSALEIFKRLRLWAEVALCLAAAAASAENDEDGRGSGSDEKARGIVRWCLFNKTGRPASESINADDEKLEDDVTHLKPSDFTGPERDPPPPNAPRLFCILGDLEDDPSHYERAWTISNNRYSRAQRSLAEHYLQKKDFVAAREAYKKAVHVNRLSSEMWSRLGDIYLRLGEMENAADSFGKAISAANDIVGGEDARTWSNLGSALWSLYLEAIESLKQAKKEPAPKPPKLDDEETDEEDTVENKSAKDAATLLNQALQAYKRGANLARENWRIWDNVLTIASRTRPLYVSDMVHAIQNILRIRETEAAVDADMLRLLLQEAVLDKEKAKTDDGAGVYEIPRGTAERAVVELVENNVVPLITARSELWELVARERAWKRDYAGAVEASERAWRAAIGMSGASNLAPAGPGGDAQTWQTDVEAWKVVVRRTDELVSVLENYGSEVESIGEKWKGKARSAVRSVMGKGKARWEGGEGWSTLEGLMEELKR